MWRLSHKSQVTLCRRKWRLKNRKKLKEKAHKSYIKAKKEGYYKIHLEENRERRRRWRKNHKEEENIRTRTWRLNNPEKAKESARKTYALMRDKGYWKEYSLKHRKRLRDANRRWRKKNPERAKELDSKYRLDNPERYRKIQKRNYDKYKHFTKKKLNSRMGVSLRKSLRDIKAGRTWESLVGYTVNDLRLRLESLFVGGMSWENMCEWHIDHITPKSRFHYKTSEDAEFKACWGLSNLQPLWKKDNLMKKDKTMDEWVARRAT